MRIPTPNFHNKILSFLQSAPADSPGATPRQPAGTAQEAVGPPPGTYLPPDARGLAPRMTPCGSASSEAILTAADACDNLSQKKTRNPVPLNKGRSRRGRPYPQNRDGSGKAGLAEGSLPRLAQTSQDIEQEIALLRSLINRLLSRRPLNHVYISRYMRLLIQAHSALNRTPKQLTDEEEVDSLIKKVFHKRVDAGTMSLYNLLPVRTAQPGDKWWPWRNLLSIEERHRDGLIGPDDRRPPDLDEYLEKRAAMDAKLAEMEEWELSMVDDWFEPDSDDDDDPYPNNPHTGPDPADEDEYWPNPADDEDDPLPYDPPPYNNPDYEESPSDLIVVPAQAGTSTHAHPSNPTHPHRTPTLPSPVPAQAETSPPTPPALRIARGRPPPLTPIGRAPKTEYRPPPVGATGGSPSPVRGRSPPSVIPPPDRLKVRLWGVNPSPHFRHSRVVGNPSPEAGGGGPRPANPTAHPREDPTQTEAPASGSPRRSRLSAPGSSPCPA